MRIAAIIFVCIAAAVAYAAWYMRQDVFRYRMTVEVDTPRGLRSASAVHQLTLRREPRLTPESGGWSLNLKGEAVAVDIAPKQTLYVLLRSPSGSFPWEVLRHSVGWGSDAESFRDHLRLAQRDGATAVLQTDGFPLFAVFRDPGDPATAELLDQANLGDAFGAGVRLRRITITMTNEPVTSGLRDRLPWLSGSPERRLTQPVDPYDNSRLAKLQHGDFIRDTAGPV